MLAGETLIRSTPAVQQRKVAILIAVLRLQRLDLGCDPAHLVVRAAKTLQCREISAAHRELGFRKLALDVIHVVQALPLHHGVGGAQDLLCISIVAAQKGAAADDIDPHLSQGIAARVDALQSDLRPGTGRWDRGARCGG